MDVRPGVGFGRRPALGAPGGSRGRHPCPQLERTPTLHAARVGTRGREAQAGEDSGGGELLCTYLGVIISLNLREQVLIYKRDRQLVVLNCACEGRFYVFHGVHVTWTTF